jgi:hypothetical protein
VLPYTSFAPKNQTAGLTGSSAGGRNFYELVGSGALGRRVMFGPRYVWMMRGVMKKISSWFEVWTCVCLKTLPRIGMLPSNGTCVTLIEF